MKKAIKIFAVVILINLTSLMKAQVSNPYNLDNKLPSCDVEFEITEYDNNCNVVAGPTSITLLAATNINWSLNSATIEVSIQMLNVNGPSCTVGQSNFVMTNTGASTCPPSPPSATLSGGTCGCGISSLVLTSTGAIIN